MKISYCCTCMNRLGQLQQTLPANLGVLRDFRGEVELVLVNFVRDAEGEQIHRWVLDHHLDDIRAGVLRYYTTRELAQWHAPIAKNTAHRLGQGDFLVNLDCDNFLCRDEVAFLLALPGLRIIYLGRSKRSETDGTFGHIGMPRRVFLRLGGYDQGMAPVTVEDEDLLARAKGITRCPIINWRRRSAIENTREESTRLSGSNDGWEQMREANMRRSKARMQRGELRIEQELGVQVERYMP